MSDDVKAAAASYRESFTTSQDPLANLLRSHLDVTLANRLMAQALGQPIDEQTDPNPFYVNFHPGLVDPMLAEARSFMARTNLSFDDWLSAIPCIYAEDFHQWLRLPDLAFTTQMEWAVFLARLPVLTFLVQYNAQLGSGYNKSYLNQIGHWVRRMLNGRLFGHGLRGEALEATVERVQQTIVPYL